MKPRKIPYLSVVIPAYNEAENFKKGYLEEAAQYLKKQKFSWEAVLVDDGSSDQTPKLLKDFAKKNKGFRFLGIPHGGKLAAVSAGIHSARGEIVLFTDFDQSTPLNEVEKMFPHFKKGADIVIANRYGKDAKRVNDSLISLIRSLVFSWLARLIVVRGIRDTQCGFKAFKRPIAQELFQNLKVHKIEKIQKPFMGAFDVELLFLAQKRGYKIASIPVLWRRVASDKLSLSEPLQMLIAIIKIRFFDILGHYQLSKRNKKSQVKRKKWSLLPLLLVLLIALPAVAATIRPGYFRMHDDLQAMRQLQMSKCFQDFQIPCRWVSDMGYGYGYPLFNYYPPMPYYLGQTIHWLGFSFLDTIKTLFVLSFLVSGLTMYLLAKEFWGRLGGIISAAFYIWAPYHAVDVYARGAMNEGWALAWFPAILWAIYKLIKENKWNYVLPLSFFTAMLMLSHNPMLMIFVPGALLWALLWVWQEGSLKILPKLAMAGIWALGLASFFTLPVILERKFAHVETLVIGYFNYLAHFADLHQLFISRFWGYGASRFGPIDDMSFSIGHLHWIFSLVALIVAWKKRKKSPKITLAILLMLFWTYGYTFMTHSRSTPIWKIITPLEFLQFPWRFLTMTMVGTSFLAGSIILLFSRLGQEKLKIFFTILLISLLVFLNRNYFEWREDLPLLTDEIKFSGELWQLQTTSGIFDFLPIWAPMPPADPPTGDAEFIEGEGEYTTLVKKSNRQEYQVEVETESAAWQINTYYFPGWRVFLDGREVNIEPKRDPELGRMVIDMVKGKHQVLAKFTETPIRKFGDIFSLISWVALAFVSLKSLKP